MSAVILIVIIVCMGIPTMLFEEISEIFNPKK